MNFQQNEKSQIQDIFKITDIVEILNGSHAGSWAIVSGYDPPFIKISLWNPRHVRLTKRPESVRKVHSGFKKEAPKPRNGGKKK